MRSLHFPLALALAALAGCYVPYHALSARRERAAGRLEQAVVDYRAASERLGPGPERDALLAEWHDAASELAAATLVRAQGSAAALDADLGALWRLASGQGWEALAPGLPPPAIQAAAVAGLERYAAARWGEVESLASRGHWLPAVLLGQALAAPLPAEHPLARRLAAIGRAGRARHRELARQAALARQWAATHFHVRLAQALGAPGLAAGPAPYQPRPPAWRVTSATPDCGWVAEDLQALLGPSTPRAASSAGAWDDPTAELLLELGGCRRIATQRVEHEAYVYEDLEARTDWVEEPVWRHTPTGACGAAGPCTAWDELGTCLTWASAGTAGDCAPASSVLESRRVPVVRWEGISRRGLLPVQVRSHQVRLAGSARLSWLGGEYELPVHLERAQSDRAFWSPQEQRPASFVDDGEATRALLADLADQVRTFSRQVLAQRAELAEALAEALAPAIQHEDGATEQALRAEEQLLQALVTRAAVTTAPIAEGRGGQWFELRYGLGPDQLLPLVEGRLQAPRLGGPTPWELPSPRQGPYDEEYELQHASAQPAEDGRPVELRSGVDLSAVALLPPLGEASLATGFGLRARAAVPEGAIELRLSLYSLQLGGEADGFEVAWLMRDSVLLGGLFWLQAGLAYERLRGAGREGYDCLSFPLGVALPLGQRLVLDVELRLNLLALKTLVEPAAGDPHFYSPLSLGLQVDLGQRLTVALRAVHYLGSGQRDWLRAHAALGVRL